MKHYVMRLSLAIFAAGLPVAASADIYCPNQISIFGTIDSVSGNLMTVDTTSGIGHIHVLMNRPRTDAHGLSLRPGVFAGIYGCLERGGRQFDAEEVTLAQSADALADYERPEREYDGRVVSVNGDRFELQTSGGNLWVTTKDQQGIRSGENVHVRGYFEPHNGAFIGSRVDRT